MYRRHGQLLAYVFLACDMAVTATAWLGSYILRYSFFPSPMGVPNSGIVIEQLPLVLVLAAIAYYVSGLYEIHRLRELPRELGKVGKASILLFLLQITILFYLRDAYESRLALAIFLSINALGLSLARRGIWWCLRYFRSKGLNYGRALIIGTDRVGRMVADSLLKNRWTGLDVIGFVDNKPPLVQGQLPWLGGLEQLKSVIRSHRIDHVFVALPIDRYSELAGVQRTLAEFLLEVQFVPDVPALSGMSLRTLELDNLTFFSLRGNPHYGMGRVSKRAIDLIAGVSALIVFSPVMMFLAAAIKLTSKGPVFYRQSRAGLFGHPFQMLKFRSMRIDAESRSGPVWAKKNDARCTGLGRFMRKWSLDELPQLFNVISGQMSLVGPRPEREVFVEQFKRKLITYDHRHQVKAGITGWAQVNGWRGNTSPWRRLEHDLYYINHWSLWLDLRILAMTLWRGFRHKNAY